MSNENPNVPHGYCHCGCGEKTSIAGQTNRTFGHVQGQPVRFRPGHNFLDRPWNTPQPPCSIEGCDTEADSRGMCPKHYTRWVRHGDPLVCAYLDPNATEKPCSACGVSKPLSEFYRRRDGNGLYRARCKACMADDAKRWRGVRGPEYGREKARRRRAQKLANGPCETINDDAIYERDCGLCGICLEPVDLRLSYPDPQSFSLDHAVPLSKGGTHTRDNVQTSHLRCNVRKNALAAPHPD